MGELIGWTEAFSWGIYAVKVAWDVRGSTTHSMRLSFWLRFGLTSAWALDISRQDKNW